MAEVRERDAVGAPVWGDSDVWMPKDDVIALRCCTAIAADAVIGPSGKNTAGNAMRRTGGPCQGLAHASPADGDVDWAHALMEGWRWIAADEPQASCFRGRA